MERVHQLHPRTYQARNSYLADKIEELFVPLRTEPDTNLNYFAKPKLKPLNKMSVVNTILNLIQKTVLILFIVPAGFKIIEFIHNLNQTVNHLRDSLKAAEQNIVDLRTTLREQSRILQEQTIVTADIQQQIVDQSIDSISATKDIGDIYDCLDLLDDRLLDLVKSEKTRKIKKQVRKDKRDSREAERREAERQEIEALDNKSPNEEVFDQFIADSLKSDHEGRISSVELRKLFKEWYDAKYVDLDDRPKSRELEEYMCRNFIWDGHFWTGIRA